VAADNGQSGSSVLSRKFVGNFDATQAIGHVSCTRLGGDWKIVQLAARQGAKARQWRASRRGFATQHGGQPGGFLRRTYDAGHERPVASHYSNDTRVKPLSA
jgi:hypothetical protein